MPKVQANVQMYRQLNQWTKTQHNSIIGPKT